MADSFLNDRFSDHVKDGNYSDSRIDFIHEIDEGVLCLPVAGPPGTPPKIVRTHSPFMVKKAEWIAEKINDKPKLPHWDTNNKNDVLVHAHWKPMSPQFQLEFLVFRCDGAYTYVSAASPNKENISLPMGSPVNLNRSATENSFTISAFDRSILRSTEGGGRTGT